LLFLRKQFPESVVYSAIKQKDKTWLNYDCVFVEVPGSANSMLQALHRIFRLDQCLTGNMIILTQDQSYDHALQARAANKMLAQIAG